MLLQVKGPGFAAGIVVEDGIVVDAAPILGYTKGWLYDRVIAYISNRHWTVESVPERTEL